LGCRAAALAGSYEAASQDLLTYAGLAIDARQLQRLVSQVAPVMNRWRQGQPAAAPPSAIEVMCIGTDGTGAPMRRPYLRGRKGKKGGRARTREVKVGTVFTHRKPTEPDQRPERDYGSTTYLAAIVSADDFGPWLRQEANRRGMGSAKTVVFLGDGAVWVWKLARLNFPGAVCILDYYHACEHLSLLAAALYGEGTALARRRYRLWKKWLLKDKVADIIAQAKADLPKEEAARKSAKLQIGYLERNRTKMLYRTFRSAGLFHWIGRGGGRLQSRRRTAPQTVGHAVVAQRCRAPAGGSLRSTQWLVRGLLDGLRKIGQSSRLRSMIFNSPLTNLPCTPSGHRDQCIRRLSVY
jgi:hypothetical protein